MGLGFRVYGLGFGVEAVLMSLLIETRQLRIVTAQLGFGVEAVLMSLLMVFRIPEFGFRVSGLGSRVLGFRVSGLWVSGFGFRF